TGRGLGRVFIRREVGGREELTAGATGSLTPSPDNSRLTLSLANGDHYRDRPGAGLLAVHFATLDSNTAFTPDAPPFRARGGN
ncbi:hypothetical protein NQU36_27705, partial [Escherichia coli]|uniref:hypothetical protein n=1 Tax=Escherichia coli TaxID=562 RepID=UPI002118D75C